MRIGLITEALPYLPSRGGFRLYSANLIRCLSGRHSIDLVSLLQADDEKHLDWARQYCASVSVISKTDGRCPKAVNLISGYLFGKPKRYRLPLEAVIGNHMRNWDVLHVEGSYVGGLIPANLSAPAILSLHDSWTLRCMEMQKCTPRIHEKVYYTLLHRYETRYERLVYPRFARCVVVAERDQAEVEKVVPDSRVVLIPYGTDSEYFHPVSVEKEPATLVFHSHLGYEPNVRAALELANEIFPLVRREAGETVLHLVGAEPPSEIRALASRPGIRISANLPDLRAAVCSGTVYVSAIRHGTGLKSKILEAMAMGMPIVCYPGSTVGIAAVPGEHLLVAQNAQEFADDVLQLLRNPERAAQLARAGREMVRDRYSWESCARSFEHLYKEVIGERTSAATAQAR